MIKKKSIISLGVLFGNKVKKLLAGMFPNPNQEESDNRALQFINNPETGQNELKIELFHLGLKDSTVILFNQDINLRYTWIYNPNPGFSVESVLGKTDAELLPADEAKRLTKIKTGVLKTGAPYNGEVQTTIENKPFIYELFVKPLKDEKGNITGVSCVSVDITERRKTVEALKNSEERFRLISENTADTIAVFDLELNYLFASNSVFRLLGYTPDEVISLGLKKILTPESYEKAVHLLSSELMLESSGNADPDRTLIFENEEIRKDGTKILVDTKISFIRDNDSKLKNIVTVSSDITEKRRAKTALQENEEMFRFISERATDLIYVYRFKPSPGFEYVSPSATTITGYTPEEHYNDPQLGFKLVHTDDKHLLQAYFENKITTGPIVLRWKKKDGSIIWTEQKNIPVYNKEGELIALQGIARDVTERKNAEEQLLLFNNKWHTTFDGMNDAVFLLDNDGIILQANKKSYEWFGKTEIIGKHCYEVVHKTNCHIEGCPFKKMQLTKKRETMLLPVGDKWFEITVDPILDNNNEITGAVHIISDITERKQIELSEKLAKEKLKQSEERLELFFAQSLDGFFFMMLDEPVVWNDSIDKEKILDYVFKHQRITKINSAMLQQYGAAKEQFIGLTPNDLFTHDIKHGRKVWKDFFDKGKLHIDTHEKKFDGTDMIIEGDYICMYDAEKRIIGHFGIQREVTTTRLAEEKLAHQFSILSGIIESTNDLIFSLDKNYCYTSFNKNHSAVMKAIYGTDIEIGKCLLDYMVVEEDRVKAKENIDRALAGEFLTNEAFSGEESLSRLYFEVKHSPIKNANGNIIGVAVKSEEVTERKRAEEELSKSKAELNEYFENDISADYVVSSEGEIFSCNKTFLDLFGFEHKSHTEKFDITQLYKNPDDRKELLRRVKENGKVENYEVEFVAFNGREIYTIINAIGFFDDTGKLIKIRGYIIDITQRKIAEAELLKLSHAIHQSPVSIIITDLNGNIEFANPVVAEITGYSLEELIGKNPRIFKSGEKSSGEYNKLWKTISSGKQWVGEFHNKKKNGELYWESASISPVLNETGEIIKYIAVKEDITERKRFDETRKILLDISQSAAKLTTLFDFLSDVHQKIRSVVRAENFYVGLYNETNNTFTFPYHVDEYDNIELNKPYTLNKSYTEYVLKTNQSLIITPKYKLEIEIDGAVKGIGEDLSVWMGVPLQTTAGEKAFGVLAIQDYKNLTSYSETDKSLTVIIANYISQFINRLTYTEELVRAKDKAEESDRLKSAFLANMSHEIRTPMNGILGFAGLLKEPELSGEKQQKYIQIIEKSGARMLNIINDIVSISKIESGIIEIHLSETNINNQLHFVYDSLILDADNKNLNLSFNCALPEKEAIIKTDSEKFYSILSNLVKNAIKYTDKGAIEFGYTNKGEEFEFYVKDTGIGIPKERQEAIFERFIQADIIDKMARQGAGLGLAISRAYVEMLNGRIWVESEEAKGSTFFFTLPCNLDSKEKINISTAFMDESEANPITPEISGLKVLIAEDDETSEMLISIELENFSKEILKATTGLEAIEICRQQPDIDLVLMDIQMPGMNGYEATRKIREFNKDVIIIAQTAFALKGDKEKAIEAGCNDYIAKPIKKDELHALIQKYFQI